MLKTFIMIWLIMTGFTLITEVLMYRILFSWYMSTFGVPMNEAGLQVTVALVIFSTVMSICMTIFIAIFSE